ncbi:hypothetical protein [Hymenobacter sp. BRD67]|uniref:hypothetical protein n=1 Tax=Hymenobacter sp. BRD67 TaxID=2675877 RepID=UPI0015656A0D|nr:hypothetical protein [Hymenobacter sp. BRD67]QKG53786.1 hypothetical protein GKZ67_15745 [Hymenobacter sp. BRD67]
MLGYLVVLPVVEPVVLPEVVPVVVLPEVVPVVVLPEVEPLVVPDVLPDALSAPVVAQELISAREAQSAAPSKKERCVRCINVEKVK